MKTKTQIRRKISSLRKLLSHAEDNYTRCVGLRGESIWFRRMQELQGQINILEWVITETKPSTDHVDGLLKSLDQN